VRFSTGPPSEFVLTLSLSKGGDGSVVQVLASAALTARSISKTPKTMW
jgi:hypothetical protein